MLNNVQKAVDPRLPSVAVAAFQTAIHQQAQFEEATEVLRARERDVRAERQREAQEDLADSRSSASISIGQHGDPNSADTGSSSDRGNAVDVEVWGQETSCLKWLVKQRVL